jgi:tetratricopeptide (TPR) repeat protein
LIQALARLSFMKHLFFFWTIWLVSLPVLAQKNAPVLETEEQKKRRFDTEWLLSEGMKYAMMEEYVRADSTFRKALLANPNVAAINHELARVLSKREKLDEAAIFAQKAYELTPENKYYGLELANIATQQRKYDKAAALYKEIIDKDPDENAAYGLELAAVYLLDDKYEEAIRAYNEVEKTLGIDEDITHQKQRIYLRLDKIEKAIDEAKKLIDSEPSEARYVVEMAQLLMAAKRPKEAQQQLEKALLLNPDEADARVMLAEIYRQNGNQQAAEQQMGQMFANPNADVDVKMQALLGLLRDAKDDATRQEVLTRAEALIKAHPKEVRAYTVYADVLSKLNRKAEARDVYVKAARLEPAMFELWAAVLQLDSELNQTDSSIAHSEQAIELFPNQGMFWYSNGTAYLMKRNYQKAADALEEALKLSSENKSLVTIIQAQLGDAYNGTGSHAKSDEAYEAALKNDPDNDYVLNNYSYFLSLRKENLERARDLSKRVVERNPTNATFLDTYAWVLYVLKDYNQARLYLEKALAAGKNVSGTILEHYGDVLYQLGEKEKALEQWKKAKALGENTPQIDKKISTGILHEQ